MGEFALSPIMAVFVTNRIRCRGGSKLRGGRRKLESMWRRWVLALGTLLPAICGAAPKPADWVPVRWPWSDVRSLDLLQGSPVNCLLLRELPAELIAAAAERGHRDARGAQAGRRRSGGGAKALAAKVNGIVLDGEFPEAVVAAVRQAAGGADGSRAHVPQPHEARLAAPILGTYQGVWPGISVQDDGAKKAGPTGSTWIDTNTGFIRAVRALGQCGPVARQRAAAEDRRHRRAVSAGDRRCGDFGRALGARVRSPISRRGSRSVRRTP